MGVGDQGETPQEREERIKQQLGKQNAGPKR